MKFIDADMELVKKQIDVLYRDLSSLRERVDSLSIKKKDKKSFERLVVLGRRVNTKMSGASTRSIINDIRG